MQRLPLAVQPAAASLSVRALPWLALLLQPAACHTPCIRCPAGETEEQHRELVDFCTNFKFERMGCFQYSAEDGTPAAELPEQVRAAVRCQVQFLVWRCSSRQRREAMGLVHCCAEFSCWRRTLLWCAHVAHSWSRTSGLLRRAGADRHPENTPCLLLHPHRSKTRCGRRGATSWCRCSSCWGRSGPRRGWARR